MINKADVVDCINKNMNLFEKFSKIFLFGSILNKIKFDDVDMILVYDTTVDLETIQKSRKNILNLFSDLNIYLDLTILSEKELIESKVLSKITYKRIK